MYGLTECKRVSYLPPEEIDKRPNSVGKGMPNEEVRIVDEKGGEVLPGETGELVVRGSNVMRGYWGRPDETAQVFRPGKYPGEVLLYSGDPVYERRGWLPLFYGAERRHDQEPGRTNQPQGNRTLPCANSKGLQRQRFIGIPGQNPGPGYSCLRATP